MRRAAPQIARHGVGPRYWRMESSGLPPAIRAYLEWATLPDATPPTDNQIALIREYLRQWIVSPVWKGDGVENLRAGVDALTSAEALKAWLADALKQEIDPL